MSEAGSLLKSLENLHSHWSQVKQCHLGSPCGFNTAASVEGKRGMMQFYSHMLMMALFI